MTAPRSFREAFTEDPADVKDRARLVAERDSARDWAVALESQNAQLTDENQRLAALIAADHCPVCFGPCGGWDCADPNDPHVSS